MILQLNPSIPVETLSGKGQAVALIDYSPEHDLYWVVFLDHNRECWTFQNKDIRGQENFSLGRSAESHAARHLFRKIFQEQSKKTLIVIDKDFKIDFNLL